MLLRDPFVQFLVGGAALFAIYGLLGDDEASRERTIRFDAKDVESIRELWRAKRTVPPTPDELASELHERVRLEVLAREAAARGLGEGDAIITRRLAQKMDFIAAELAGLAPVEDSDLVAYYAAHADDFEVPPRVSFRQVTFSRQSRGEAAEADARRLLALVEGMSFEDARARGDATLLPSELTEADPQGIARRFGDAFAGAISEVATLGWRGPVASSFGWHVVEITALTPARQPPLEEVREAVRVEVERERSEAAKETLYRELRRQYRVELRGVDVPGFVPSAP